MTFLVEADVPRSAADVVRRHGSDAVDGRDITPPPLPTVAEAHPLPQHYV